MGMLTYFVVLPDLSGDLVTVLQLIDETLSVLVNKQTTDTAEGLSSQELGLCVGLIGVNETSGLDRDRRRKHWRAWRACVRHLRIGHRWWWEVCSTRDVAS